jgi:hypothetical protein
MNPELFWFGLVWTALLFWILVGWCPLGPDGADTPGPSDWSRARPGAVGRHGDVLGGPAAAASQPRKPGG